MNLARCRMGQALMGMKRPVHVRVGNVNHPQASLNLYFRSCLSLLRTFIILFDSSIGISNLIIIGLWRVSFFSGRDSAIRASNNFNYRIVS